jgi:hypothetical protein
MSNKYAYLRKLPLAELEHERREILNRVLRFRIGTENEGRRLHEELNAYKAVARDKMRCTELDSSITFNCNTYAKLFLHRLAEERGITVSDVIVEIICEKLVEVEVKTKDLQELFTQSQNNWWI